MCLLHIRSLLNKHNLQFWIRSVDHLGTVYTLSAVLLYSNIKYFIFMGWVPILILGWYVSNPTESCLTLTRVLFEVIVSKWTFRVNVASSVQLLDYLLVPQGTKLWGTLRSAKTSSTKSWNKQQKWFACISYRPTLALLVSTCPVEKILWCWFRRVWCHSLFSKISPLFFVLYHWALQR